MRSRNAFTLVEVLIVVMMLGILTAMAVPRLSIAVLSRGSVEVTARKIAADLRLARQLAITHAATNPKGFELDMVGRAPYGSYQIKDRQSDAVVVSHTIDSDVACRGAGRFRFGPLGNLEDYNPHETSVTCSSDGKSVTIAVVPATGMVQCE